MPLPDAILSPIAGDNPSGRDLRYTAVYDQIKEARREDDELAQGAWQRERKVADHATVIRLAQEAIATQSKDLQLAAWLTASLLKSTGFAGLRDGLNLCRGLIENFWDTLYPQLEDGDSELRAAPLDWVGARLDVDVKKVGLTNDRYNFLDHQESRAIPYEDQAKTKEQKNARETAQKENKILPELFDKSFGETPKSFYLDTEKKIDGCLDTLTALHSVCQERFTNAAPSFGKLKTALEEVRHVVHSFLQKKREFDPDPVEEAPPPAAAAPDAIPAEAPGECPAGAAPAPLMVSPIEPAANGDALAAVAVAAQLLRKRDPRSPAPYLMLRGLRWGELRATSDPSVLEAPPTEMRRQIKSLALNHRWSELLEAAEAVMGQSYGRAWLDLQRFVVEACVALGRDYDAIAIAIRSELRALLWDLPKLMHAMLADDTPAANPETQAWLGELMAEPVETVVPGALPQPHQLNASAEAGWHKKFIDPHALALDAMRKGQPQKAFEIIHDELARQRCGRGRFLRKLQLAQVAIAAGKDSIAQPLLDDLAATIETHKLEDWEDRELVSGALAFLLQSSKKIQGDAKTRQAFFERICRLDPVQAFAV